VRAYHDLGFAEKALAPDEDEVGVLKLQPWAKVSGRLMQGGKPIAGEAVYFRPLADRGLIEARFQDSFYAETDSEGRFAFDRLPPTSGAVKAHLGPWQESPMTSSQSLPLEFKPGEHREVVLNGEGITITGRVVATGRSNDELSKQWSLNYLVSRDRGLNYPADAEPLSFDPSGPLQPDWLHRPDFEKWSATRENHFVKLAEDGQLKIFGVAPGEYDLVIQLYEQPAGCLVETIGEKIVPITITGSAGEEIELGDIEVECRQGPRVDRDMRAFQFADESGQVRYVDDMKGRYVLFHAWATWCAPCIETMPEIAATIEKYADQQFTPVGLNLDKEPAVGRAMADKQGWDWAQNYLGDDSELSRQLAISTVPAYYLIGPDGKLVGSANDWHEIAELLKAELP
jgi:thiol-disulfide isomerase/thioredoxin